MDDLLELETVAKKYFGVGPVVARRKAALGTLPIAAFRLNNSRRGPFFVRAIDLELLITDRAKQSQKLLSAATAA
jgi:hypothetical protein